MHKHVCLSCDAVINEGEFDCERDTDHDYALCVDCSETEYEVKTRPGLTKKGK